MGHILALCIKKKQRREGKYLNEEREAVDCSPAFTGEAAALLSDCVALTTRGGVNMASGVAAQPIRSYLRSDRGPGEWSRR